MTGVQISSVTRPRHKPHACWTRNEQIFDYLKTFENMSRTGHQRRAAFHGSYAEDHSSESSDGDELEPRVGHNARKEKRACASARALSPEPPPERLRSSPAKLLPPVNPAEMRRLLRQPFTGVPSEWECLLELFRLSEANADVTPRRSTYAHCVTQRLWLRNYPVCDDGDERKLADRMAGRGQESRHHLRNRKRALLDFVTCARSTLPVTWLGYAQASFLLTINPKTGHRCGEPLSVILSWINGEDVAVYHKGVHLLMPLELFVVGVMVPVQRSRTTLQLFQL